MRKSLRYLRIAFSATGLIACVLLIVLWVRSYWWVDMTSRNSTINICSMSGKLLIGKTLTVVSIRRPNPPFSNAAARFGFYPMPLGDWVFTFENNGLTLPYWLCILVLGLIARAPWILWPKRFSIRTLLIATTLIAVVLGLIVCLVR